MKAFILAAGLGTRLRPLTENQPKVMVEVGGKKILERTIIQLKKARVDDLVINTHYFPEVVPNYFGDGSKWGVKIQYSFEPEILGTAGGLKKVEANFKNETEFLVVYGDNIFDLDFTGIINAQLNGSACMVMLFDRTKSPNSGIAGGVVEVSNRNFITGFFEGARPVRDMNNKARSGILSSQTDQSKEPNLSSVFSNGVNRPEIPYVNGGVYKCTPEIFKLIPENIFYDFGKQVFPEMLAKKLPLQSYIIKETEAVFGADTHETLKATADYLQKYDHN